MVLKSYRELAGKNCHVNTRQEDAFSCFATFSGFEDESNEVLEKAFTTALDSFARIDQVHVVVILRRLWHVDG